jgi:uncharacterized C2H2 Zn-finger protein
LKADKSANSIRESKTFLSEKFEHFGFDTLGKFKDETDIEYENHYFEDIANLHETSNENKEFLNAFCDRCGKGFETKEDFLHHFKRMHATSMEYVKREKKTLQCPICSRIAQSASVLKKHIRCVHGPKPFLECDICGRVFHKKATMLKHMNLDHTQRCETE